MKKFTMLMAAAVLGLSASAADWYLVGDNYGWSNNDANKFEATSDANVFTKHVDSLSGGIKIKEASTWSTSFGSNGSKLAEGVTYNANKDGGNISVNGIITNCDITINVVDYTILVTGAAAGNSFSQVYIIGDINGNGWNATMKDYALSKTATDTYEGNITVNSTSYVRFVCGAQQLGLPNGELSPENGVTYDAVAGTENCFVLNPDVNYAVKVVVNQAAEEGTVTFTFDGGSVVIPPVDNFKKLYLRGSMNEWNNLDGWNMLTEDGKVYTFTGNIAANSEFKIADANWGDVYAGMEALTIEAGTYTLENSTATANMKAGINITSISFNVETLEMTVKGEGGVVIDPTEEYADWYVNVYGPFNNWQDNGEHPVNGISTHDSLAIGTSSFKVKIWNGTNDVWYVGNDEGVKIPQNVWTPMYQDVWEIEGPTVEGAVEGQCFKVQYNVENNSILIEAAVAVETVAAANADAIYFNLQGARVANPENGLYIRVMNGKAQKVIIK